jgi:1-acyl-sn-glycerol-3-phosphate acyltransferase
MKKKSKLRAILRSTIRFLFALLSHIKVEGLENLPATGAAIMAANHLGRLDPSLVFIMVEREDATGLVAKKYQKKLFFRWLVNAVGGIWINREETDFQALRTANDYLSRGGMLGIAPEGTRSRTGALMYAKTGVAFLAHKAKVLIIPVAITGTEKFFSELARLRRPHLRIRFGHPFTLPPLEREDRSGSLQRNTDEIMCQIAALLPPDYRGVYADHPRTKQLLATDNKSPGFA